MQQELKADYIRKWCQGWKEGIESIHKGVKEVSRRVMKDFWTWVVRTDVQHCQLYNAIKLHTWRQLKHIDPCSTCFVPVKKKKDLTSGFCFLSYTLRSIVFGMLSEYLTYLAKKPFFWNGSFGIFFICTACRILFTGPKLGTSTYAPCIGSTEQPQDSWGCLVDTFGRTYTRHIILCLLFALSSWKSHDFKPWDDTHTDPSCTLPTYSLNVSCSVSTGIPERATLSELYFEASLWRCACS